MEDKEAQRFLAELDRLGEDEVARRLGLESYAPREIPFVREWLLRRAEERARDKESPP